MTVMILLIFQYLFNRELLIEAGFKIEKYYIVEGNKIYYSRKGHNDYWVDISDNDVARKNLHKHIGSKYNYRGYEDNEREIGKQIAANTYNYKEAIKPKAKRVSLSGNIKQSPIVEQPSSTFVQKRNFNNPAKPSESKTFIDDIIEDNKDTLSSPRAREDKVLYGDCVLLTASEHDKLVAEFGADDTARLIDILDLYLANKTKDPYKSHYAAIKKWCVRDLAEQKTAEQRLKNAQEAGQRVNAQHAPATGFGAGLADANRRFKEITDKYKN